MKILFIVNPAAGHGHGMKRWDKISAEVLAKQPKAVVWYTAKPGDGSVLARKGFQQGFEAIIAVGGDGTLGEVVDGYLDAEPDLRQNAVLGAWPAGSGCDAARHLGLLPNVDALCALLSRPNIRRLDAGLAKFTERDGKMHRRHFLNMVALGIGGEVAWRMQNWGKPLGGTLSYLAISALSLLTAKAYPLEIIVDGVSESVSNYHLLTVANTRSFGGGMRIAPNADPSDGRFDLVTVGNLSRLELLRRFPLIYSGGHIGVPGVRHRLVRRLEVRSRKKVSMNIDGEALGFLPAAFEILPAAVPFLCP